LHLSFYESIRITFYPPPFFFSPSSLITPQIFPTPAALETLVEAVLSAATVFPPTSEKNDVPLIPIKGGTAPRTFKLARMAQVRGASPTALSKHLLQIKTWGPNSFMGIFTR
jgi:hypothetical protein